MRFANSTMTQGLKPHIVMWCSSSEGETSADAFIKNGYHGAFTYFFGEELKKNPKQTRLELLLNIRKALRNAGYQQTPRLKAWNAKVQLPFGS